MSYPDSVRYLYSLGNEMKVGAKFGLERMRTLLEELGHPERGQRFVHVAGTNGKGSTCAMIASALRQAGLRTGLNTSPHLIEPTERIQVDGVPITTGQFSQAFDVVRAAAERLLEGGQIDAHPSYFETVTAMALLVFRDRCDISVMEVGLGGRLDATNVVTPALTVITPVSFDHETFLGNTLESIAFEKAGILKEGAPLVLGLQAPPAENVILNRAHELHCAVTRLADAAVTNCIATVSGSSFELNGIAYECILPGRRQLDNAATAVLACQLLDVDEAAIQQGLKQTRWPGRLEVVSRSPNFILDGAHNPAGAQALSEYIREFFSDRPVWLVFGAMRDKALEEVTSELFPLADRLILTAPDMPRALRPESILAAQEHPNCSLTHTAQEALALARAAPPEAAVFFTGSLYLVGEVRALAVAADRRLLP